MRFLQLLLTLCVVLGFGDRRIQAVEQDRTVRVVYLVSKDREERADYKAAIEKAIADVRNWYARQLDGATFKLHDPIVEVVKSRQEAAWFYSHRNGQNKDDWGYNNTLAEAKELVGAQLQDPHFVWVIYSDGPGDKGRGGSSVTCMPEEDLIGLIGQHEKWKKAERWIGGLAHELGHAFGLAHPSDTVGDYDAVMWCGFYEKWPQGAYLTGFDKMKLMDHPFFFFADGSPVAAKRKYVEKFSYGRGYFGDTGEKGAARWQERSEETANVFKFEELVRDDDWIFIKDRSRGYAIKLPRKGGMSKLTGDDGAHWQDLYAVQRE
jgi:hypothetical protein